jgi:hypothetical protein
VLVLMAMLGMLDNSAPNVFEIPNDVVHRRVEVQAHRGGLGMRSEESLWVSFRMEYYVAND